MLLGHTDPKQSQAVKIVHIPIESGYFPVQTSHSTPLSLTSSAWNTAYHFLLGICKAMGAKIHVLLELLYPIEIAL